MRKTKHDKDRLEEGITDDVDIFTRIKNRRKFQKHEILNYEKKLPKKVS